MFQLETMLPLLILVFLGIPAVSTQDYYGSQTGKHFCIVAPEGKNVTGIKVSLKGNIINRIRLSFGDQDSEEYGSPGGNPVTTTLNPNEDILGISGSFRAYLHQIIFVTSQLREIMMGNYKGILEYTSYPRYPDQKFRGICGFYDSIGIKGFKFLWGGANSTCTS